MILVIGVLVMTGLAIWIAVGVVSVAGIETPRYEIVSEHDGYEIRQYAPHIVAEVTMEGDFRTAMNGGFRKLADYIFGNNTKTEDGSPAGSEKIEMTAPVIERVVRSEKIEMTAPVLEQQTQTGTRVVSFVMPSKYSMDTLPKPNNAEVRLVEVPSKRYAVIRFSGTVSEASAAERKEKLLELLKRDALETIGEPMLAQYNPPWTPPPMRRNEVMVELK
jgi:effector-binding domain-containing protein